MRYIRTLALVLVLGMVGAAVARADVPPGWGTAADYQKAVEFAKKNGQAIAVLYTFDPLREGFGYYLDFSTYVQQDPGMQSMLKLMVYAGDGGGLVSKIQAKFGTPAGSIPVLYILDQNGNPLGFADYGDWLKAPKAISIANQVTQWINKSDRKIAIVERGAAIGRYDDALKAFAQIEKQDQVVTAAVAQILPAPADAGSGEPAKPTGAAKSSGKPAPTAAQTNAARAGASIFDKPGDASKSDKPDATPVADQPPGRYYPNLLATKRAIYEAQAEDRVTQARAEFGLNHYVAAKKLLNAMVADHADFDAVKEAADLLKTIQEAEEDARKAAAKPAAASTAPPSR